MSYPLRRLGAVALSLVLFGLLLGGLGAAVRVAAAGSTILRAR